jgi:hypothetical protein
MNEENMMQTTHTKQSIVFWRRCLCLIVFWCVAMTGNALAQVPETMSFTGYLTDNDTGLPVDGEMDITFALYDVPEGGDALWSNTKEDVRVADGVYTVRLGSEKPIRLREPNQYYLGVQHEGDSEEMRNRIMLTSVLSALTVKGMALLSDNTFVGPSAGRINRGQNNTFIGVRAGNDNTQGDGNTFIGYTAGDRNSYGVNNTFIGARAGLQNTQADCNTVVGSNAGYGMKSGGYNTFVGAQAGNGQTGGDDSDGSSTGRYNTFVGFQAGSDYAEGSYNTFVGAEAGQETTEGSYNTFLGAEAGRQDKSSGYNTFVGAEAGEEGPGSHNTLVGAKAGRQSRRGGNNVFVGAYAGANTRASSTLDEYVVNNTFVGYRAGQKTVTERNTFVGVEAGTNNTTGEDNIFIGAYAGENNTTGSGNIYIGTDRDMLSLSPDVSNRLVIGSLISGDFDRDYVKVHGIIEVQEDFFLSSDRVQASTGRPIPSHCDSPDEAGRMVHIIGDKGSGSYLQPVRGAYGRPRHRWTSDAGGLYICLGASGWGRVGPE